jgi:hypothetical protein
MAVCAAGHMINTDSRRFPENNADFCKRCGAKTVTACATCGAGIPGPEGRGSFTIPKFCKSCGAAFPWKIAADEAKPERKSAIRERTTLAEENIADVLRAIPRGLRELAAEHRHRGRLPFEVKDEYDLQDFVRALLQMWYPKAVKPEEPIPTVGGKGGRVDFVLDGLKWLIELKVFRDETDWKATMFSDITSKIERYGKDPRCDVLFVLIYDPNRAFRSAVAVEHELSAERTIGDRKFRVHVIVTPQA